MALRKTCDICGKYLECENHVDIEYNEYSPWWCGTHPFKKLTLCMDCLKKEAGKEFFDFLSKQIEDKKNGEEK